MFDLNVLSVVFMIILLEGILSIDNAAVLGAMVSGLPPTELIPWPRPLRFLGKPIHRLLGGQRSAALKVGLLGAYFGRALMLFFATFIVQNPWLRILGALYLIKLAFENLGEPEVGEDQQVDAERMSRRGFWNVVLSVELADLAFSVDNVVAVIILSDNYWLILFGVAMGILTMRFAATIFTSLIEREPVLKPAAYVLVLVIGVKFLVKEFLLISIETYVTFFTSLGILLFAVLYSHFKPLQIVRPLFYWLGEGMADFNELADWALIPFLGLLRLLFRGLKAIFVRRERASNESENANQSEHSAESFGD